MILDTMKIRNLFQLYILNFKLGCCLDKFNIKISVGKYNYNLTMLKVLYIMCSLSDQEDDKKIRKNLEKQIKIKQTFLQHGMQATLI